MKRFLLPTLTILFAILLTLPSLAAWAEGGRNAPALTPTATATPITNAISLQVTASEDDASVRLLTKENLNTWVYIRNGTSETAYVNGIRFQNVQIPPGSRILEARLSLFYSGWHRNLPVKLIIQAEATDSARSYANDYPLVSERALTASQTLWEVGNTPTEASWLDLPDISAIVQEVTDRPGWQSGNALSVVIQSDESNPLNYYFDARSYDFGPAFAPKLEIVYETNEPVPTSTPTATPTPTVTPTPEPGRLAIEQALTLTCGARYEGDTQTWDNNVSTYTACRPDWPETGPEAVYRLDIPFDNTDVHFQIFPANPAQDLDIFLLTGAYPEECLQGADASLLQQHLAAGTYYVAVDGYNGAAGAFTLVSNCTVNYENDLYLPMMTR